jgi:predicted metal-dependent phosphoesterase TrpH
MTLRPAALVLLVGGLTIGSATDVVPGSDPPRPGARRVLSADFHVHAFPGDGVLPAWELRKEAARRGLDVIAITNHNQRIAASLPTGSRDLLPIVIPGQEITTPAFHLVAVGVRQVIDWRLPLPQMIDAVHAQGGVAIAAHPVKDSWRVADATALRRLDGTEAMHTLVETSSRGRQELLAFYGAAREQNRNVAAIGSSDFHAVAPLGGCRTFVFVDEVSERGVLDAIRRGQTVAADNHANVVGNTALGQPMVRVSTGAAAASSELWRRLSVTMVLAALVLLVCFR